MLKAITNNEQLVNVKATKDGKLLVDLGEQSGGNTKQEIETTLNANVHTIGTNAINIAINKKVTSIMIANFSESANLSLTISNKMFIIGSGIATSFSINKEVDNISITATEEGTKAQVIVEGVE